MKLLALTALLPLAVSGQSEANEPTSLQWKCSTEKQRWQDLGEVPLGETKVFSDKETLRVLVNSNIKRQQIDGLGCQWDSAPTMDRTHLLHP